MISSKPKWDYSIYFRFRSAVEGMVTGTESLQVRLGHAVLHIRTIETEHMPPEMQQKYTSLIQRMTCVEDEVRGSIMATAEQLSNEEAGDIARRIVHMMYALNREPED